MRYWVPAYLVIDVKTPQDAARCKQAVENLLQNPIVRQMLQGSGVPCESISVADAVPINEQQAAAQRR